MRCRDRFELPRLLTIVEDVSDARRALVGRSQSPHGQAPVLFDIFQNAAELVLRMLDVRRHVGRDDDHRYAESEAALVVAALRLVQARGSNVIVEAAPIVPQNDYRAGVPVLALADLIDDAGDPRRTVVHVLAIGSLLVNVVGVLTVGRYPGNGGQVAVFDIREDRVRARGDVGRPLLAIADGFDRVVGAPNAGVPALHLHRIVLPGDRLRVEEIAHRRVGETGKGSLEQPKLEIRRYQRGHDAGRRVASPRPERRIVDYAVVGIAAVGIVDDGAARDQILMRGERSATLS